MRGLCQCGCGRKAPIATRTHRRYGWVKGQPKRFIFNHHTKKPHLTARQRVRINWEKRGGRAYHRKYRLKTFGLTPERFDAMLKEQDGRCAICGTDTPGGHWNFWYIDHDHACCDRDRSCGRCIRGLLCNRCNITLGWLRDSKDLASKVYEYLDKHFHLKSKEKDDGINQVH